MSDGWVGWNASRLTWGAGISAPLQAFSVFRLNMRVAPGPFLGSPLGWNACFHVYSVSM